MHLDKMVSPRCCVSAGPLRSAIWLLFGLLTAFGTVGSARADCPTPNAPDQARDLTIDTPCTVNRPGTYFYGQINIVSGGVLDFEQPTAGSPDIDFWASSIVVESNGALQAGMTTPYGQPRADLTGGFLTIYLYGANQSVTDGNPVDPATTQGQGVLCKTEGTGLAPCGIPAMVWSNNGTSVLPGCAAAATTKDSNCIPGLPAAAKDFFYAYGPLYGDSKCTNGSTFAVTGGKALCGADPADGKVGYFGYKVLAVSYGGSLVLNGYKGVPDCVNGPTTRNCLDNQHLATGNSWLRLEVDVDGSTRLPLSSAPGQRWWLPSDGNRDQIVVTTTDYLPSHSEELTVSMIEGGGNVTFTPALKWRHSGTRYPIGDKITNDAAKARLIAAGMDPNLIDKGADTRAAVALLTRNIRIVSGGDTAGETFAQAGARTLCPDKKTMGCYYFGGHTIFRQGFKQIQIQGAEFANLGQGGKKGHYPIHFHESRQAPPNTFVNDSSVNESNTRWYVLHDTQGVTLQRDVGWRSIGHGFYFEDGTEAGNNLYSDIGILARAAVEDPPDSKNPQNPQQIPGILADNQGPFPDPSKPNPGFPYRSDNEYPTVFWITNGWNNFQGNMAAGAGACGSAYWFVPMGNTDTPDVPTAANQYVDPLPNGGPTTHMKWADGGTEGDGTVHFGYAGLQRLPTWAGATPLESFYSNYATSTMMSFQTTLDAPSCAGFISAQAPALTTPTVREIASFSPRPTRKAIVPQPPTGPGTEPDLVNDPYYPHVIGAREATRCAASDSKKVPPVAGLPPFYDCTPPKPGFAGLRGPCADGTAFLAAGNSPTDPNNPMFPCAPTVIDHFTSSFHWAQGDVSAMWLRPQWYLVTNSVVADVQQGGITFVTGGDVTRSSIITGYWGLLRDSILIGHTQPQDTDSEKMAHRFALDIGPFNSFTTMPDKCEKPTGKDLPSYCLNQAAGISLPLTGFFNNQRLENIYDGPSYRDSNAYLDVNKEGCPVGDFNTAIDTCIYGTQQTPGVLQNPGGMPSCYLPNAAIAWKQPNGFFYPPAFHTNNLYFGNVDIRHFVIDPLFKAFDGSTSRYKDPMSADFGQAGTYITDQDAVSAVYCLPPALNPKVPLGNAKQFFNGFTSIDRQTELNDDDGTLTGLSNNFTPALGQEALKQTISVNEDDFFTAPVETPECASNIGPNTMPANACNPPKQAKPTVTAKTSPYDYVSTVVYHLPPPLPPAPQPPAPWDADCTNPTCYGVPLYRQFLAGDKTGQTREWEHWIANNCNTDPTKFGITKPCRWPFIRMAGTALGTRETLTVNNGTYYIDTTVPLSMQLSEVYNTSGTNGATSNVTASPFLANETYYVFFVYAKPTTRQTYEVYLGPGATAANVQPIQFRLDTLAVTTLNKQPWLTPDLGTGGIVNVAVDFTQLKDGTLDTAPKNGLCQPVTFCKASGTTCGSALTDDDPLVIADPSIKMQADAVCSQWAVKDLDCPPKGCYGFSFKMTDGFTAEATPDDPSPHRPAPDSFPSNDSSQGQPTWRVKFVGTTLQPDSTAAGQCHYTTLPTYPPPPPLMGECIVPDWIPH